MRYRLQLLRLCVVMFGLFGVVLLYKNSLLWQGIPSNKSFSQVYSLAEKIPERALVFIPDEAAGLHLQTALSYMGQKDVLLLPAFLSRDKESVVISYIRRQQKRGIPVFMLIFDASRPVSYQPLLRFSPVCLERGAIDIQILSVYDCYGNRSLRKEDRIPYALFSLKEYTDMIAVPFTTSIDVGDISQDYRYLLKGFFAPENNESGSFRWTNGKGNLYLPSVSRVTLVVGGGRPPGMQKARLKCTLYNGEIVYEGSLTNEKQEIVIRIPAWVKRTNRPFNFILLSDVFYPNQIGTSRDGRKLGIQLYRVELKP